MKNKGITIYPPAEIAMNDANCAPVTLSEEGERVVTALLRLQATLPPISANECWTILAGQLPNVNDKARSSR